MDEILKKAKIEFDKWRATRKSKNSKTPDYLVELAKEALKTNSVSLVFKVLRFRLDLIEKNHGKKKQLRKKTRFVKADLVPSPSISNSLIAEISNSSNLSIKIYSQISKESLSHILDYTKGDRI